MPFLKQQIEIVNNWLLESALADERFKNARIEAIAVDCSRTETSGAISFFPAVMDQNNMAQEITVDDTYGLIIYHKVLTSAYTPFKNNSTGDRYNYQVQSTRVKMVVYGKFSAIQLKKEQLEALLAVNFPDNIPAALSNPLKLDNMTVTLQSSNMISAAVWQEEYKGTPLRLAPEDIYFSMTYDLQSNYRKGCFKICDCKQQ